MAEQTKEPVDSEENTNQTDDIEILDAEETVDNDNKEETDKPESKLEEELDVVKSEKEELYERYLRIQAEYDNFKRRTQREKVAERKYKSQALATELLPALDNFERALEVETTKETKSVVEGITMVYKQIKSALESEDIKEIECVGKEFDPNLHHAVVQEEDSNYESNIILEELQKGYILHDRVIRAAMVKVNK